MALDSFTQQFFLFAQLGHNLTLYLLILLSIFSIGFIIERFTFFSKLKKSLSAYRSAASDSILKNSPQPLKDFASSTEGYESEAIQLGMSYVQQDGTEGIYEYIDSYKQSIRPQLDRFLNALASIGSNAPFIGLLGTVFGVMEAFQNLAISQGEVGLVMIGIAKALMATAIGLFVAIPATVAFNTFQKKSRTVLANIDNIRDLCVAQKKKL